MRGLRRVEVALVQPVAVFRVHLSGEVGKLILVTHVFFKTTRYLALSNMSLLKRPWWNRFCVISITLIFL